MSALSLSSNEFCILNLLWSESRAMTRPEILEALPDKDWNPNSIHLILNNMIKKGVLQVVGVARCGRGYGRTYAPTLSQTEYAAAQALELLGMPEARLNIAQAIIFICESPKSGSVTEAVEKAFYDAEHSYQIGVPPYLRDTHYSGSERTESGKGYLFPHDFPGHYVPQQYLPDNLADARYYAPTQQGAEAKIAEAKRRRDALAADWKKSQK